jgi:putative hydrolase of the HAD superfamily
MKADYPNVEERLIRCVAFDLDGVLIPSGASFEYFEREHGITRNDFREFFEGPYQPAMLGEADLFDVLPDTLKQWKWRGTPQAFARTWFLSCPEAEPAATEIVKGLRARGIACYAASNQDGRRAMFLDSLPWVQTLFDRRFYSCRLGVKKPSTEYFDIIRLEAALSPESILFLDDNMGNVEGARRCGWSAELCTGSRDLKAVVVKYFPHPVQLPG